MLQLNCQYIYMCITQIHVEMYAYIYTHKYIYICTYNCILYTHMYMCIFLLSFSLSLGLSFSPRLSLSLCLALPLFSSVVSPSFYVTSRERETKRLSLVSLASVTRARALSLSYSNFFLSFSRWRPRANLDIMGPEPNYRIYCAGSEC